MLTGAEVIRFEKRIDLDELRSQLGTDRRIVKGGFPEGITSIPVEEGIELRETVQLLVERRDFKGTLIVAEIRIQPPAHRIELLALEIDVHG